MEKDGLLWKGRNVVERTECCGMDGMLWKLCLLFSAAEASVGAERSEEEEDGREKCEKISDKSHPVAPAKVDVDSVGHAGDLLLENLSDLHRITYRVVRISAGSASERCERCSLQQHRSKK